MNARLAVYAILFLAVAIRNAAAAGPLLYRCSTYPHPLFPTVKFEVSKTSVTVADPAFYKVPLSFPVTNIHASKVWGGGPSKVFVFSSATPEGPNRTEIEINIQDLSNSSWTMFHPDGKVGLSWRTDCSLELEPKAVQADELAPKTVVPKSGTETGGAHGKSISGSRGVEP